LLLSLGFLFLSSQPLLLGKGCLLLGYVLLFQSPHFLQFGHCLGLFQFAPAVLFLYLFLLVALIYAGV
jgi:hypothetical protein